MLIVGWVGFGAPVACVLYPFLSSRATGYYAGVPKSEAKDGRLGREWQRHRPPRLYLPPEQSHLWLGEGSPSHCARSRRVEAFAVAI